MTPERWRTVEDSFLAALELQGPELESHLNGLDPDIKAEVEGMLRGHDQADRVLPVSESGFEPAPGDRIGPYKIVRQIGRGGMGVVFQAERSDSQFEQQVAIKVLTAQIVGTEGLARFRMERQILALLDHPNIVRLLDGGVTANGSPYFAMELVDGEVITTYCTAHGLSISERVRLFCEVCSAIDYAHRHQVIHRDIKPANILVTSAGVVKVLDFGIAKVLAPLTGGPAESITTRFAPLTPGYASPEHLRGVTVTTASDIYSLGLVLYELLTDVKARPTTDAGSQDSFEPKRPSAVTSRQKIGRDLDSIVLKAISPNPSERYGSALELSRDLDRYLKGEPVIARQATVRYIVGKALRRHKTPAAIATVLLAAVGSVLWWEARQATLEKQRRYDQVREVTRSMLVDMQNRIQNLPGSLEARKNLTAQALGYLEALRKESAGDPDLQIDLARAYLQMATLQGGVTDTNLGDANGANQSLEQARALAESVQKREPQHTGAAMTLESYYRAIAVNASYSRNIDLALPAAETALAISRDLAARYPANTKLRADVSSCLQILGNIVGLTDRQRKLKLFLQSSQIIDELLRGSPGDRNLMRSAALAAKNIGAQQTEDKQLGPALVNCKRALQLDEQLLAFDPRNRLVRLDVSFDLSTLSSLALRTNELDEAEVYMKRCVKIRADLAAEEPKDIRVRDRLSYGHALMSYILVRQKKMAEALREAQTTIDQAEQLIKDAPSTEASARMQIAWAYGLRGYALEGQNLRETGCAAYRKSVETFDRARHIDSKTFSLKTEEREIRERLSRCK